jgi:hypothetical protein
LDWESSLAALAMDLPKQSALRWGNKKALFCSFIVKFVLLETTLFASICTEHTDYGKISKK